MSGDSVAPAGEDYGTPHDDPCDCQDCRKAVAAQGHLPDCNDATDHQSMEFGGLCICAALRACEARVRAEQQVVSNAVGYKLGYAKGRADERETFDQQALFADAKAWGYAAGLDAARDAVAALVRVKSGTGEYVRHDAAIAAIAAVRGGSASDVFPLDDYIPRTRGTEDTDE